jgi:hypothetical protein
MLDALVRTGLGILDKVIPDPKAKAEAKERLLKMAQDGDLKKMQAELQDISDARSHDKASYGGGFVDFMRGIVRPVITLAAFAFYVYAKFEAIGLTVEDYSIIGMVLAFWFGGKFLGKDVQK